MPARRDGKPAQDPDSGALQGMNVGQGGPQTEQLGDTGLQGAQGGQNALGHKRGVTEAERDER